jgi:hypothetical protein
MAAANKLHAFTFVDALERPTEALKHLNVLNEPTPHSTVMAYIKFNLLK